MTNLPAPLVLVADDDEEWGELLLSLLKEDGYRTLRAYDGEEALRQIIERQPDLVLLDVNMPRRNGFDVCGRIKRDDLLRRVKVVMFTKRSEADDLIQSSQAEADAYLTKPVDIGLLKSTIKKLLAQAK
ncbi:MAG: response regulator [Elusimicrobia bacterium]|nr:response regulator [Elusimicrobiota bacterium]